MYLLISPAKTLDFNTIDTFLPSSLPVFKAEADKIAAILKKKLPNDLSKMMKISDDLARLNYDRYQQWSNLTDNQLKEAAFAFKGDVYQGLEIEKLSKDEIQFAQNHLRILSGLYGLLRPLDKIAPYRLEMGTDLSVGKAKNLYEYWKTKITRQISEEMKLLNTNTLVNLASNEYFKSVDTKKLEVDIISPVFKDYKNGEYKIISFFSKKARGRMSRYLIQENATDKEIILGFQEDGYHYNESLSTKSKPVFTRG
ncbi:MAG: uncharacterized protein PWQ54_472 [Bacteroidales bacterium]|jgi:cytoplasmic iron level regulating protein YaaA (DUF328/UPF0246 family)|nr:uncharacterized protein [Bacteroidales bacterium]